MALHVPSRRFIPPSTATLSSPPPSMTPWPWRQPPTSWEPGELVWSPRPCYAPSVPRRAYQVSLPPPKFISDQPSASSLRQGVLQRGTKCSGLRVSLTVSPRCRLSARVVLLCVVLLIAES